MGRRIDPNDEQYNGGDGAPLCGPGEKLFAAVGIERYTATTGSRCLSVRFVCLLDRAKRGDERHEVFENFVLEDSSMWRFVKFAKAIGYNEPFDVDDDQDVEKVVTRGYLTGIVETEIWEGKERGRVTRWLPAGNYTEDPEWSNWIKESEQRHIDYLDWREANPRGSKPSRGSRGGSRGNSGGSRSSGGVDSDAPF
jgi:hypothetical protein